MRRSLSVWGIALSSVMAAGCVSLVEWHAKTFPQSELGPREVVVAPVSATPPLESAPQRPPPGASSLYSERSFVSLTSDRRTHRVGDLVTVMIYENSSASSTADTGASRDAAVSAGVSRPGLSRAAGITAGSDFSGTGRTQRSGRVLAQLTVAVREVTPNQDLLLAGEQRLEINGETQTIRLEGRARSRDISELNTLVSTRLADARISFVGDGVVADRQKPAWWQWLLGVFGL